MGLNLLKNLMSSRMPYLVLSSVVLARLTMPPPLSAFSAWTRVVLAILAKPAAYSSSALSAMTSTAPNVSGTYTYRCCTTVRSLVLASPEGVCHSRTRRGEETRVATLPKISGRAPELARSRDYFTGIEVGG